MSYASSPKSFPNFLKSLPHKLSQPTAIAVIASVGIHAALGFSLPYFPTSSQEKPKPVRNVQLLELKPEELSRVPPSPLPLEPLSPSLNQQLTPLSPSGSSTLPALPSLSSNTPTLGDLPSFDPLPSLGGSWKVPRRSTNLGKLARNSPVRTDIKTNPGEPPLPSEVFNSQSGKSSANPQFKIATGSKITPRPNLSRDLGGLTRGLLPANDNALLSDTFNSNPPSRPLPPPPPAGAIALNPGATGTQFQNQFGATTSTGSFGSTPQATAPVSGQSNSTGNSSDPNQQALLQNVNDWSARNQVTDPSQRLKLSRDYPQTPQAAGQPNGGAVMVVVKVDENGKIISDSLQVMGSSFPNDSFDQEAISSVRGHEFPRTGKPQAYYVQVQFKHGSPVPGSVTGSPNSTDGKNSTERQNLPQPSTPTEGQNSPQRFTPTERLTPPEQQNSPEWSTPIERKIPSLRPNSSEQPNPTEGKNPTERPNSSEQPNPTEGKNPTERPNSSERSTPTEQTTPPKRENSSERSIPLEQLTPPKREKPSERSTPTEQTTPPKRENPSERSTPTEQTTPPKRENPSERSTPTEQTTPPKRENSTERSIPLEQLTPPKRENSTERSTPTERITPPKRENSTERSTPTERKTPPKRENSTERSTPTERKTPVERQNSPDQRSSSESQNSEKPQKLPQPQSSEKPQRLPQPPNSAKP